MILGILPGATATGGVQRICRHAATVLTAMAEEADRSCRLLGLNDPPGEHRVSVGDRQAVVEGLGRARGRLARETVRAAGTAELLYLGHPHLAPLALLARLRRPGLPVWVATYGIDVWEPLSLPRRLALGRADGVTALSRYSRDRLVDVQGVDPGRVHLVPPALDPGFLDADAGELPDVGGDGPRLLTVARLAASERYKGVDHVLRALPLVRKAYPNVDYVVVGDGDDRVRLERLADDAGARDAVRFVGERTGQDLLAHYAACDVFVMPSRAEGFGIVFLEAMAFGKPVIGGDHGGTRDVVVDGETGYLVRHGDIDALADRLVRLLKDEDLRRRMGQAGRRRVLDRYTFEAFHERLSELLEADAT